MSSDDTVKMLISDVYEIQNIMHDNIQKTLNRDEHLDKLIDKSNELSEGAAKFNQKTIKIRRKMWFENCKYKIIVIIVLLILILILSIIIWAHSQS